MTCPRGDGLVAHEYLLDPQGRACLAGQYKMKGVAYVS